MLLNGMTKRVLTLTLAVAVLGILIPGCQTLRQVASLRQVDFDLGNVNNVYLAGVNLDRVQNYNDLRAADIARIATSLAQRELPLAFQVQVLADNPADNPVDARLLEMDWTLFLEDRETISGVLNREILLPSGATTNIPLDISLDLVDFFGDNLRDLVELALAVSGQGGAPKSIRLQAVPSIQTPLGPLRYPQPVTIVARDVGQ